MCSAASEWEGLRACLSAAVVCQLEEAMLASVLLHMVLRSHNSLSYQLISEFLFILTVFVSEAVCWSTVRISSGLLPSED